MPEELRLFLKSIILRLGLKLVAEIRFENMVSRM